MPNASYYCLLHFLPFSRAQPGNKLTRLWQQTLQHLFQRRLVRAND